MKKFYSALGYFVAIVIWLNAHYTLEVIYGYNETADQNVWNIRFGSRDTNPENSSTGSNSPAD